MPKSLSDHMRAKKETIARIKATRERIIAKAMATKEGRAMLAQAMLEPLRKACQKSSLSERLFKPSDLVLTPSRMENVLALRKKLGYGTATKTKPATTKKTNKRRGIKA